MYDKPQFEIPAAVRELAERNVAQVRQAYDQVLTLMRKSQEAVAKSQGAMAQSAMEIQAKSLEFAQANIESNFRFASELARARDLKEYLETQSRYAQSQLEIYSKQAQEITRLMSEAAHKSQP
ncbi:MAG: phasin family protein [Hyphomicrobiaceae bacterium]|nr:phasin family protein [Hyphomicrobiaceae bacterium]